MTQPDVQVIANLVVVRGDGRVLLVRHDPEGHWVFATGGGMAIVEADDAAALVEAVAPYTPFFDFKVEPVVSIEDGVPIYLKTNAWRDSVA